MVHLKHDVLMSSLEVLETGLSYLYQAHALALLRTVISLYDVMIIASCNAGEAQISMHSLQVYHHKQGLEKLQCGYLLVGMVSIVELV